MKKNIALLFIAVSLVSAASQCDSLNQSNAEGASPCENSEWLNAIVSNAKQRGNKGEIIQYQYNHETVFSVNTCIECSDAMTVVYNCAGETKCQFGGIAGLNTCPDFEDKATGRKVIWSN